MLTPHDQHRLDRAQRRLIELRAWRNAREAPISPWQFSGPGVPAATLQFGDRWPVVATPVEFSAATAIPEGWAGEPVELELWLGGEGLVKLSTGLQAGLNPFHHSFPVSDSATGGMPLTIAVEAVPKGMFGSHNAAPFIERAHLVVPAVEVRALERDLSMIVDACLSLGDHEVIPHLLDTIDAAFKSIDFTWPTATDVVVSRLVQGYVNPISSTMGILDRIAAKEAADVSLPFTPLWSMPAPTRPLEPLPEETRAALQKAHTVVQRHLAEIMESYPPVGRLALTGHAHIDLAWLWPLAETRRKVRRTFSTVLDLMDRYQDFTFNQSSAQAYAWIEEDDPAVFAKIRERVAEGRWEPVGGSWCEPDCQVTGGEAFVRQLFYGQRYFREKFGIKAHVAWLPDVFGFSGGIPQLLRGAGIDRFFTIKLTWNETNPFPYDLFEWEGIDGSRVVSHMFANPGQGYNGNIAPLDVIGTWRNFKGKRFFPESLLSFGWGDGGGGPSAKMLENYTRLKEFPVLPRLRMANVEAFFAALPTEGLPRWVGELYLEYHRGTLTTQAMTKQLNRMAEHRLLEAEAFAAVAQLSGFAYPTEEIATAWQTLLLNQFHDILPGSSIAEVYEDNHRLVGGVVDTAVEIRDTALRHVGHAGSGSVERRLLVANAGLAARPLSLILSDVTGESITDLDGAPIATQPTDDGLLVHDPERSVPGIGWITLKSAQDSQAPVKPASTVSAEAAGDGFVLENDNLRVEIAADGTIAQLQHKTSGREALADRANQLWLYIDKPRTYDAWDIDEDYEQDGRELTSIATIAITEAGPLRASVRVERAWRDSRIVQTYRLLAASSRLEIETDIDWHERFILLKARFPLAVHTDEATFETMYGATRRPTHRNTTWDAAKFEVSGHRFADLSEAGFGVALLNDSKYGHGVHDNVLTLSLVRGPIYPHPLADEGQHHFTYSLLPHAGDWTEAPVVAEAFALNSRLIAAPASTEAAPVASLVEASGQPIALGSLKRGEDGSSLILRLYEPHGGRGTAILTFDRPLATVERVTLLEETQPDLTPPHHDGQVIRLDVRPFEVVTLRVVPA